MRVGLLLALLGLVVSSARAEVRIVSGPGVRLRVEVHPVARGTWTTHDAADPQVVNAGGDILGDGPPAISLHDSGVALAWVRPVTDRVVLHARQVGLAALEANIPARAPRGTPIVIETTTGWQVAWQQADGAGPSVATAFIGRDASMTRTTTVEAEVLVGAIKVGRLVLLVAARPALDQLLLMATIPTDPDPFPLPSVVVSVHPMVNRLPAGLAPSAGDTRGRGFDREPATSACLGALDAGTALVAWPAGAGLVGYVRVTDAGVLGGGVATFIDGPSGSCEAVLNAAERDAR